MTHLHFMIGLFLFLLLGGCAEENRDVPLALDTETDSESKAPLDGTDDSGSTEPAEDTASYTGSETIASDVDGTDGASVSEPETGSGANDGETAGEDTQPERGTDREASTTDSRDSETSMETETVGGSDSGEGADSEWGSHTDAILDSEAVTDSDMDTGGDSDFPPEGDASVSTPWPDGKYIAVDEVHDRLMAADPEMLLINVVDEVYYSLGHIEGSLKIPWDTLEFNLGLVDPTKHIVVYCRRGVRSESAYDTLVENSYPMVWVMEGGIEAWTQRGYPTLPE